MKKLFVILFVLVLGAMFFAGCDLIAPGGTKVAPEETVPADKTPAAYEEPVATSTEAGTTTPVGDTVADQTAAPAEGLCKVDGDCVPKPECHPHECMLKSDADKLEKPQICTMMYDYQAAYSAGDCACKEGACVNKNLGRTSDI